MTFQTKIFVDGDDGEKLSCAEAAAILSGEGKKTTAKQIRNHIAGKNITTIDGLRNHREKVERKLKSFKPKPPIRGDDGKVISNADVVNTLKVEGYTAYEQKVSYYRDRHGAKSLNDLRRLFGENVRVDSPRGILSGEFVKIEDKIYKVAEVFANGAGRPDLMCNPVMTNGQVLTRTTRYISGTEKWRKLKYDPKVFIKK